MKMLKNTDGDVLTTSSPRADTSASNTATQSSAQATTSLIINNFRLGALSPKARMIAKWKQADCVCFDVDSTVCMNEAIDDLAYFVGVGAEVERMTKQAMSGNVSFRDALRNRLNIIRPSEKIMHDFVQHCSQSNFNLTPRIDELVEMLHARQVNVYLISGGFRLLINPVADQLCISRDRIYANRILFEQEGSYAGFCEKEMTSESGGKGRVIEHLKETHGYRTVIMIGDGATDLESYPPADGFIGFGGNVCREKVKQNSDWFVYSFAELIDQLK